MHLKMILDRHYHLAPEVMANLYAELGYTKEQPVMVPLGNRVIIRRTPPKEMEGEIMIAQRARAPQNTGTVVAVGPDVQTLKVGNFVLFGHYQTGTEVPGMDGEPVHLMSEPEILAVLQE